MADRVHTKAMDNATRFAALLAEKVTAAALYRTHRSGTAHGVVRRDVYLGTVRWAGEDDIPGAPDGFEFTVGTPGSVYRIDGWISRRGDRWIAEDAECGPAPGSFETPAAACAALTRR